MSSTDWPPLSYAEWEPTCDTLHMWTQIVGKTRMALAPPENHWWGVALYVTPRGLTTSPIPFRRRSFEVEFDLIAHQLRLRTSEGEERSLALAPRSVADFFADYKAALAALGIEVTINPVPVEFDDTTPFDQDRHHAAYDRQAIEDFRRVLVHSDRVLKQFRGRFLGKSSPVHFFWGSFDLAVTRFSGRRAALPADVDPVTREAYSREVISCGFWPGGRAFPHAVFYCYTKPEPPGLDHETVRPAAAYWDKQMGEFLLKYDDVRNAPDPDQALLDFCQSTYDAGARLAGWDRRELER